MSFERDTGGKENTIATMDAIVSFLLQIHQDSHGHTL
jgi:hypothetical protein